MPIDKEKFPELEIGIHKGNLGYYGYILGYSHLKYRYNTQYETPEMTDEQKAIYRKMRFKDTHGTVIIKVFVQIHAKLEISDEKKQPTKFYVDKFRVIEINDSKNNKYEYAYLFKKMLFPVRYGYGERISGKNNKENINSEIDIPRYFYVSEKECKVEESLFNDSLTDLTNH